MPREPHTESFCSPCVTVFFQGEAAAKDMKVWSETDGKSKKAPGR